VRSDGRRRSAQTVDLGPAISTIHSRAGTSQAVTNGCWRSGCRMSRGGNLADETRSLLRSLRSAGWWYENVSGPWPPARWVANKQQVAAAGRCADVASRETCRHGRSAQFGLASSARPRQARPRLRALKSPCAQGRTQMDAHRGRPMRRRSQCQRRGSITGQRGSCLEGRKTSNPGPVSDPSKMFCGRRGALYIAETVPGRAG